jgi:hypothetical protein
MRADLRIDRLRHIMVFGDYFKNHILPDQIHILNVAFLVPDMPRIRRMRR